MTDIVALQRENFQLRKRVQELEVGVPKDTVQVPAKVLEAATQLLREEGYRLTAEQLFVYQRNG